MLENILVFYSILVKYTVFFYCIIPTVAAAAKSLQSCPTLCDPIYDSPPSFPVPGILQRRKVKSESSVVSDSQRPHGLQPTRLLRPWIFQAWVLEWGAIAFSICIFMKIYYIQNKKSVCKLLIKLQAIEFKKSSCPCEE